MLASKRWNAFRRISFSNKLYSFFIKNKSAFIILSNFNLHCIIFTIYHKKISLRLLLLFFWIFFNLPEKSHCGSTDQSSIFDSILIWEIIGGFDRSRHSFNSQESRKIGSIRWYDNQGKKPPHSSYNSCGSSPGIKIRPIWKKNYEFSSRFFSSISFNFRGRIMCTLKPWYNEPQYSEFRDIVNKTKHITFDIVNYSM